MVGECCMHACLSTSEIAAGLRSNFGLGVGPFTSATSDHLDRWHAPNPRSRQPRGVWSISTLLCDGNCDESDDFSAMSSFEVRERECCHWEMVENVVMGKTGTLFAGAQFREAGGRLYEVDWKREEEFVDT